MAEVAGGGAAVVSGYDFYCEAAVEADFVCDGGAAYRVYVCFFFIITGVFGTSISPYMFFWQASEEVEEERAVGMPMRKASGLPLLPRRFIRDMRVDTLVGMVAAELAQWFIIITTATVLFTHGVKTINTAADAAKALEPLVQSFPNSGQVAKDLFAVGVVGLGLLGIPVLAGSAAYALAEAFGWKEGFVEEV